MVNNVYDLVTRTMEQEFPGRVAFRWVEDATGTVKERPMPSMHRTSAALLPGLPGTSRMWRASGWSC